MSTYIYNDGIVFNSGVNLQGYISQLSNNSGYLYGNTFNEVNRNSYGVGWLMVLPATAVTLTMETAILKFI